MVIFINFNEVLAMDKGKPANIFFENFPVEFTEIGTLNDIQYAEDDSIICVEVNKNITELNNNQIFNGLVQHMVDLEKIPDSIQINDKEYDIHYVPPRGDEFLCIGNQVVNVASNFAGRFLMSETCKE